MDYKKKCKCCGHLVTAYTHRLNKPLVKALRELVDFYDDNKQIAKLQRDLELTKNQYNNFQKLQYFGLVKRIEGKGWLPTAKGTNFIYGAEPCMVTVGTFGKDILPLGHEAWETHNKVLETKYVQEVDEFCYKRRAEYKAEKQDRML